MIKKFLKIAGVKNEQDFYKKYPSESAFFKAHPEAKDLKMYKKGGELKKLNQLTDFGDVVKAQRGWVERAANAEFECKGHPRSELRSAAGASGIAGPDAVVIPEWQQITDISGLRGYPEGGKKKEIEAFTSGVQNQYNLAKSKYPNLTLPQYIAATRDAQRYSGSFGHDETKAAYDPKTGALLSGKDPKNYDPYQKFYQSKYPGQYSLTPDQVLSTWGSMPGGFSDYEKWSNVGYTAPKQKKGGSVPKLQNAYPQLPNNSDPLLWGSAPPISGTSQPLPMLNPNPAPIEMDPDQRGTFQMQLEKSQGAVNPNNLLGKLGGAKGIMDTVGQIAGIVGKFKEEKENLNKAKQFSQVAGLVKKAAGTRPEAVRRKYDRPEDYITNPNELFPTYGVGTNYLAKNGSIIRAQDGMDVVNQIGGNPTEIQNMYNPGTLYDNLGFEPLSESEMVKQYAYGGGIPRAQDGFDAFASSQEGQLLGGLGSQFGSMIGGNKFGQTNAGADLGGMLGGAAGSLLGPGGKLIGKFAGGFIGGALDQKAKKTERLNKQGMKDIQQANLMQGAQNLQTQYSAFVRDGGLIPYAENGWISHDWQPQVITQFGEHNVNDLLTADPMMDTLRTGGRITQNNMFPVDRYNFGGELKTTWGGYAEPMSQNPYLPGTGETVMFRGKSHEESDGKGHTGIGVKYGDGGMTDYAEFGSKDADADVEVERGEPAVELMDGDGEKNMVVYGNLHIPNSLLHEIGDPNAKGKKFKNYVAYLSKKEIKQNKKIEKAIDIINNADPRTVSGKIDISTGQAIMEGATATLRQYAEFKKNAASVQSALNETAEEQGVVADDLAKGKITMDKSKSNQARFGAKLTTAQNGDKLPGVNMDDYEYIKKLYDEAQAQGKGDKVLEFQKEYHRLFPDYAKKVIGREPVTEYGKKNKLSKENLQSNEDAIFGKRTKQYMAALENAPKAKITITSPLPEKVGEKETKKVPAVATTTPLEKPDVLDYLNMLQPYLIPTDAEQLDPTQLYPEMYGIASNQLEPVQAQLYQPLLQQPYDISLQDQLNEITAQEKSAERLVRNNPEALASMYAQTRAAKDQVLGEQFRMNQAMKAGVYNANRQELNNAHLKNLEILDNQYVRQAQAKSKTKETGQAIVNSIASKILNNKLENRTLQVYENMYNYRFDPRFRAINYNPLAQFNIPQVGKGMVPIYDKNGNLVGYQQGDDLATTDKQTTTQPKAHRKHTVSKNGSILRELKNL